MIHMNPCMHEVHSVLLFNHSAISVCHTDYFIAPEPWSTNYWVTAVILAELLDSWLTVTVSDGQHHFLWIPSGASPNKGKWFWSFAFTCLLPRKLVIKSMLLTHVRAAAWKLWANSAYKLDELCLVNWICASICTPAIDLAF